MLAQSIFQRNAHYIGLTKLAIYWKLEEDTLINIEHSNADHTIPLLQYTVTTQWRIQGGGDFGG